MFYEATNKLNNEWICSSSIKCYLAAIVSENNVSIMCIAVSVCLVMPQVGSDAMKRCGCSNVLRHLVAFYWPATADIALCVCECTGRWSRRIGWPASAIQCGRAVTAGVALDPQVALVQPSGSWPLVKQRARPSATSSWPVNGVKWTTGQKVSNSVVDQTILHTASPDDFVSTFYCDNLSLNSAYISVLLQGVQKLTLISTCS